MQFMFSINGWSRHFWVRCFIKNEDMSDLSELCKKIFDNNGGDVNLYTDEEKKMIDHFIKLGWIKICFNADDFMSYKLTYDGSKQIKFESYKDDLEQAMDNIHYLLYEEDE